MPQYFFRISHGRFAGASDQGSEFDSREAAWAEMTKVSGNLLGSIARSLKQDAEWQMEVFLFKGWASPPGAIEYARQHPELSPGWIAQHVQQSADGSLYDPHHGQAVALNQKFCGGEGL